jgi:hypothetical protein
MIIINSFKSCIYVFIFSFVLKSSGICELLFIFSFFFSFVFFFTLFLIAATIDSLLIRTIHILLNRGPIYNKLNNIYDQLIIIIKRQNDIHRRYNQLVKLLFVLFIGSIHVVTHFVNILCLKEQL